MLKRFVRPVLLGVIPLATVVAAGYVWLSGGRFVATENAYVKTHIAHISPELDGRVSFVAVEDHAHVKSGDVLVELDRRPFQVALAKAEAEVDAARQGIRTLVASLAEAKSERDQWTGRVAFLVAQLARQKKLARRGIVASTRLEEAAENARGGRDRLRLAEQKVQRVLTQIGGDPARPVDEHPTVREKLAALKSAKLDLSRTRIRAPINGQVVNLRLQPGEQIEIAKPILAIVADTQPWIEANFKETELTHVSPGMTAEVQLDIDRNTVWQAEVASISPATGAEFALLPPQNASGNWVKVVQRLPVRLKLRPIAGQAAPVLRAGMTARVSVDTKRLRSLAQLLGSWSAQAESRGPDAAAPRHAPSGQ